MRTQAEAIQELRARTTREAVLEVLVRENVPVDVTVTALADVIALAAVTQDLDFGQPRQIADRLDAFCRRVEQTYARAYPEMSARRARQRELVGAGQ